jgi:hypothetical protein
MACFRNDGVAQLYGIETVEVPIPVGREDGITRLPGERAAGKVPWAGVQLGSANALQHDLVHADARNQ